MAQIIRITSEALQATIRRLLPSQQGFGEDLQASNVIQPIIDLTPSAEGSETRADLQTAIAFGSNSTFDARNSTVTIANTPGFYKVQGLISCSSNSSVVNGAISISDGLSNKALYDFIREANGGSLSYVIDLTVFLRSGDTLSAISGSNAVRVAGSSRQIADVNGDLVNPIGFSPQ